MPHRRMHDDRGPGSQPLLDEIQSVRYREAVAEGAGKGPDPKEAHKGDPGEPNSLLTAQRGLEPGASGAVMRKLLVHRIEEDVGVDDLHRAPATGLTCPTAACAGSLRPRARRR